MGFGIIGSIAVVTVIAVASAIVQPVVGRLRDVGLLSPRIGMTGGLALIAVSVAAEAFLSNPAMFYASAITLGIGIGGVTSLGFTQLATTTPPDRLGRTMGNAELGREVGDAGGPLLIGAVATGTGLAAGLATFACLSALIGALVATFARNEGVVGEDA